MDLSISEDQQTIREVFADFFATIAGAEAARDAEPLGFDQAAWDRFLETGGPGMGVTEHSGGGGASLADLVVVAQELGRNISPLPFVDHAVAARLLDSCGITDAAVVEGTKIATMALHPVADGFARLVPSGAIAESLIVLDGNRLLLVEEAGPGVAPANHACMPLADRWTTEGTTIAEGDDAATKFATALNEWRTLTAAALNGITGQALDIALDYVQTRHQFDRPVGAFQAVQHGLADIPGQLEGSVLLTGKAAWAADRPGGRLDVDDNLVEDFDALARMAYLFASELAAMATDRSLHYHGGYGFSEEYDIQLYYRRARGWPLVLDDPAREARALADVLLGEES